MVSFTIDVRACFERSIWRDNSTDRGAVNKSNPQIDHATCCTTCLWASHTGLGLDSKINPLLFHSVHNQCLVHLEKMKNWLTTFFHLQSQGHKWLRETLKLIRLIFLFLSNLLVKLSRIQHRLRSVALLVVSHYVTVFEFLVLIK